MSSYVVDILDGVVGNQDYPEYEENLKQYNLDLVGISCLTHSIADTQMTANIVRKLNPNAIIVLGGPHCEMFPEYAMAMDNVDAIVIGDGEQAFLEIIQRVDNGEDFSKISGLWWKNAAGEIIKNTEQKRQTDLNWQIWPDRRRVEYQAYLLGRETPWQQLPLRLVDVTLCPFCLTYKKQRKIHNVDNILDENEDCISIGIQRFTSSTICSVRISMGAQSVTQ